MPPLSQQHVIYILFPSRRRNTRCSRDWSSDVCSSDLFRSRIGKPFSAGIRLTADHKLDFDFGQARLDEEARNPPDFSSQESVGACPKSRPPAFCTGGVDRK